MFFVASCRLKQAVCTPGFFIPAGEMVEMFGEDTSRKLYLRVSFMLTRVFRPGMEVVLEHRNAQWRVSVDEALEFIKSVGFDMVNVMRKSVLRYLIASRPIGEMFYRGVPVRRADLLALIENCPVEIFEVVDRAGGRVKIAPHGSSDLLIELQTV